MTDNRTYAYRVICKNALPTDDFLVHQGQQVYGYWNAVTVADQWFEDTSHHAIVMNEYGKTVYDTECFRHTRLSSSLENW